MSGLLIPQVKSMAPALRNRTVLAAGELKAFFLNNYQSEQAIITTIAGNVYQDKLSDVAADCFTRVLQHPSQKISGSIVKEQVIKAMAERDIFPEMTDKISRIKSLSEADKLFNSPGLKEYVKFVVEEADKIRQKIHDKIKSSGGLRKLWEAREKGLGLRSGEVVWPYEELLALIKIFFNQQVLGDLNLKHQKDALGEAILSIFCDLQGKPKAATDAINQFLDENSYLAEDGKTTLRVSQEDLWPVAAEILCLALTFPVSQKITSDTIKNRIAREVIERVPALAKEERERRITALIDAPGVLEESYIGAVEAAAKSLQELMIGPTLKDLRDSKTKNTIQDTYDQGLGFNLGEIFIPNWELRKLLLP